MGAGRQVRQAAQTVAPRWKSWTALATSSSTRMAFMAMAAADPSPAAVMTCARGLARLPATQSPGTLVRHRWRRCAPSRSRPGRRPVSPAGRCSARTEVGRTTRRGDDAAVVHLDTAQGSSSTRTRRTVPSTTPMARAASSVRWVSVNIPSVRRRRRRRSTAARSGRSGPRQGVPPMTPSGRSRTSWPWQYGQCSTSRAQRSRRPSMSGSSSRSPVARSTWRVDDLVAAAEHDRNPPLWQAVTPSTGR